MSVQVKVKFKLDGLKAKVNNEYIHNNKTANDIRDTVLGGIKKALAVGLSPVKKFGRLAAYAVQRKGKGYPEIDRIKEKYPDKKTRPVNLSLSGKMLKDMKGVKQRDGVLLGYMDDSKSSLLARVHNSGERKDIPQRKFLPTGPGEEFILSLTRAIKDIYLNRIRAIIKDLNR